jgi:hypothetical protein
VFSILFLLLFGELSVILLIVNGERLYIAAFGIVMHNSSNIITEMCTSILEFAKFQDKFLFAQMMISGLIGSNKLVYALKMAIK